jgi:uncharacterized protein (DUF2236 family)
MSTEYFVNQNSVVRRIWGKSDTILFIFAGAAAEFALNKAVDWLYFTGRLPAHPINRLFSTVSYARAIVFSEKQSALKAIDAMAAIHATVEAKRGSSIPDWAYRDVLFMLIDYSIRSFEVLERKMTNSEKNEVFNVFTRIGFGMGLKGLPETLQQWQTMRNEHLSQNMERSKLTNDLFKQYRKHLGATRYRILLEVQILITPPQVRELLDLDRTSLIHPLVALYKACRTIRLDWAMRELLLPNQYKKEIKGLDVII